MLVVTRHKALVAYLVEIGMVPANVDVIEHATPEQVKGKDIVGVLPLSLACLANSVTEIPLAIPAELRGKELDLDTVRKLAGEPVCYEVRAVAVPK